MKYQLLPVEMITKIFETVDAKTFVSLRFVDRTTYNVSTTGRFLHLSIKEIEFDNGAFCVLWGDGSRAQVGPRNNLTKEQITKGDIYREVEHICCLTFRNYLFNKGLLDLLLPRVFPKLRSVQRLRIAQCTGGIDKDIGDWLNTFNVADLIIINSLGLRGNIDDHFLEFLKGVVYIEQKDTQVTASTLKSIVVEKRPVFKLIAANSFWWECVIEAIEIVIKSNWNVDWHLGVVGENRRPVLKRQSCLPRVWDILKRAQVERFEISFTEKTVNNFFRESTELTTIKMKYQLLPAEMITKILETVDAKTFVSLRFVNRTSYNISKTERLLHRSVKQIEYDEVSICVVLGDNNRVQVGPRNKMTKEQLSKVEIYRKVEHVDCLSFRNYKFSIGVLDLILPRAFPKLRSIKRLQLQKCSGLINPDMCEWLTSVHVDNFYISDSSQLDLVIDDDFLACLKGRVYIESERGALFHRVTDRTLNAVVAGERPEFKLIGASTQFTWQCVTNAIEMKFQHLPVEMIEKVMDATDFKTFRELILTNRNILKIASTDHFRFRNVDKIVCENTGTFAVLVDGSRVQLEPVENLTQEQKVRADLYKQIEDINCLTYLSYAVKPALFDILKTTFPKLRSIERMEIAGCTGSVSNNFYTELNLWNTKCLLISRNNMFLLINDDFSAIAKCSLIIEHIGSVMVDVTDKTLQMLVAEKIPVFKFNATMTNFTWKAIHSTIEVVTESEWDVNWHFGIVGVIRKSSRYFTKMQCDMNELEWKKVLRNAEVKGFKIRFLEENDLTTVLVLRDKLTIQFTTCALVGKEIKEAYSSEEARGSEKTSLLGKRKYGTHMK